MMPADPRIRPRRTRCRSRRIGRFTARHERRVTSTGDINRGGPGRKDLNYRYRLLAAGVRVTGGLKLGRRVLVTPDVDAADPKVGGRRSTLPGKRTGHTL